MPELCKTQHRILLPSVGDHVSTLPERHVPAGIAMLQPYPNLATRNGPTQAAGLKKKSHQAILVLCILPKYLISSFFTHLPLGLPVTGSFKSFNIYLTIYFSALVSFFLIVCMRDVCMYICIHMCEGTCVAKVQVEAK